MKKIVLLLVSFSVIALASSANDVRQKVIKTVAEIQKADYEGNLSALKQLYDELSTYTDDKDLASRIRYWRGFAMWRRAINGFNDAVAPKELERDLMLAIDEFHDASAKDPGFVDAKVGKISCLGYLMYLNQKDQERVKELLAKASPLNKEAIAMAPENPRLIWVRGPILWNTPPERGGGQAQAIASYEKGLEAFKNRKTSTSDPLEPSWGEPELMMNLAWSYQNRTTPDLNAAEQYALAALKIVPYWHYVRDILLPQIRDAKAKALTVK